MMNITRMGSGSATRVDATVSKPNDSINPKHRVGTMKLSSTTPRSIRARIAKGEAAAKMRRAHSANAAETKANNATPSSNNELEAAMYAGGAISMHELVKQERQEHQHATQRASTSAKAERYATTVRKPALKGANFTRHQGAMIMQPQRRKGLMVGSL